ncbi:MAG: efflux RND transporter periplasmic adaptor subunit [Vicinamibacterales bacterium]
MRLSRITLQTAGAGLAIAALASGCGSGAPQETAPAAAPEARTSVQVSDADAKAAGIETAPARMVERTEPLQASGVVTFDERRTARLGSLVEGVVAELRLQPGDQVSRGAIVARLHSHVIHDAWADYFKAQAEHRRTQTELEYARTAEARAAQLVADKALSPQELERARADVNAASQAVAAAMADIIRGEQELEHYGIKARPDANPRDEGEVPVMAPFAGTVIERLSTEGAPVTPGTPLLVISDLSRLWITAEIDEALIGRVATGSTATIRTAAYPGETFTGTLTAIGAVVNPLTRRVTLRIEVDNTDRRLKPQMFVTASLGAAGPRRVLVVPSRAVQAMEGETVVFVRTGADQFARRSVRVGAEVDGLVEVVSGLAEGDVVATAGAFLLKSDLLKPAGDEES